MLRYELPANIRDSIAHGQVLFLRLIIVTAGHWEDPVYAAIAVKLIAIPAGGTVAECHGAGGDCAQPESGGQSHLGQRC